MKPERIAEIAKDQTNQLLRDTDFGLDVVQEACIQAQIEIAIRAALVEGMTEAADCVPTTWLDPLLSGPNAVLHDANGREIEALLRAVQDRIRAKRREFEGQG